MKPEPNANIPNFPPHEPEPPICNNPKFFEIFGKPCNNLKDFLMDDAKNNHLAYMANLHQQEEDERYRKLLSDLGLEDAKEKDFSNYLNNKTK